MKQKIYLIGLASFLIVIIGTLFKMLHFPGAGPLLTLGFFGLLILFFPMGLVSSYKAQKERRYKLLYIVTYITLFILFTGVLFKIMHWPSAAIWLLIALPLPFILLLPVFLIVTGKIEKFSIYNTVTVLLLLTFMSVFNALLALNVAKDRLHDSAFLISIFYQKGDLMAEQQHHIAEGGEDIIKSSENLLQLIEEAKDKFYLGTLSNFHTVTNDSYYIPYLDSKSLSTEIMFRGEQPYLGYRLDESISQFIEVVTNTGSEIVTKDYARSLLEFNYNSEEGLPLSMYYFGNNWTAWSMLFLSMLENNVILLRNDLLAEMTR
jgi:hypothetical protein